MKVCFVCADAGVPVFGRKGCSTHVRETYHTLVDLGHEVRLVCANTEGDDAERDRFDLIGIEPLRSKKLGFDLRHFLTDRRVRKECERLIGSWNPDAIYERYSLYSTSGTRLAQRHRLPHVLEVNALLSQEQSDRIRFGGPARWIERKIFRAARHVVVVSDLLGEQIASIRGDSAEISRLPMAVNLERFNPSVPRDPIRERLGLQERFVIGYVGALTGWHGIALLYELARELEADSPKPFTILVVGGDQRRLAEHMARVEREGLSDRLRFIGEVPHDEVPGYIRAMDAALVPDTTPWTSPAKTIEYLGCGVPVLAPRYPAIEKAMRHGEEGWIFTPRNVTEMAEGVRALWADPAMRAEMSRRARGRAERDHSWKSVGLAVEAVFERQARELDRATAHGDGDT